MAKTRKLFAFSDDPEDLTYALLDPADYLSRFYDGVTAVRRATIEEAVGDGNTVAARRRYHTQFHIAVRVPLSKLRLLDEAPPPTEFHARVAAISDLSAAR